MYWRALIIACLSSVILSSCKQEEEAGKAATVRDTKTERSSKSATKERVALKKGSNSVLSKKEAGEVVSYSDSSSVNEKTVDEKFQKEVEALKEPIDEFATILEGVKDRASLEAAIEEFDEIARKFTQKAKEVKGENWNEEQMVVREKLLRSMGDARAKIGSAMVRIIPILKENPDLKENFDKASKSLLKSINRNFMGT